MVFRLPNHCLGVGVVQPLPPNKMCHNNIIQHSELYLQLKTMDETNIAHPLYGYDLEVGSFCTINKDWLGNVV